MRYALIGRKAGSNYRITLGVTTGKRELSGKGRESWVSTTGKGKGKGKGESDNIEENINNNNPLYRN